MLKYILNNFFFFSILGHVIEKVFNPSNSSGILYFYWTPVYGLGVLTIYFIYYLIHKIKCNRLIRIIINFILCFLILSILELLGGILIEKLFNIVFWDYSNEKYHIGKYICLKMSLCWGIAGIVLYYIKPIIDKIIRRIPLFFTYILSFGFIIDVILTIIFK